MKKSTKIKLFNVYTIGGILIILIIFLAGCGKKEIKELEIKNKTGTFINEWAKEDFTVEINSKESGFNYCIGEEKCSPNIKNDSNNLEIKIEKEKISYICAKLLDSEEVVCEEYKLDKTSPTIGSVSFDGIKGKNDWYTSDVVVKVVDGLDELSGHDSTTTSIDKVTNNTKDQEIIVTTKDKAGNEVSKTYNIKVDKEEPSIMTKTGELNLLEQTDKKVIDYFDISYKTSEGTTKCTPENTKSLGHSVQTITCTVTSNNGKTATATKQIIIKPRMVTDISNECIQSGSTCSNSQISSGISFKMKDDKSKIYNFNVLSDNGSEITAIMTQNYSTSSLKSYSSYISLPPKFTNMKEIDKIDAEDIVKYTTFYKNLSDKSNWQQKYAERIYSLLTSESEAEVTDVNSFRKEATRLGYGDILLPTWLCKNVNQDTAYITKTSVSIDSSYVWTVSGLGLMITSEKNDTTPVYGLRYTLTIDKTKMNQ